MTIYAAAGDVGKSAALALCSVNRGERPHLVAIVDVFGDESLWWKRALAAAVTVSGAVAHKPPCRIEVPPNVVRGGGMAHHRTGHGLGMRAGLLRAAWFAATGDLPETWTPSEWWAPFKLGPKRGEGKFKGAHRIAEAAMFVGGCRELLAAIPEGRRVDAAEAVLSAAAHSLILLGNLDATRRA